MSVQYIGKYTVGQSFPLLSEYVQEVTVLVAAVNACVSDLSLCAAVLLDLDLAITALVELDLEAKLEIILSALLSLQGGLDLVVSAILPIKLSASLEFQGALRAQASLALAISNPLGQAMAAISAMAAAMVSLKASLALGLPTVSAELGLQVSAVASVAAAAAVKMAGIQLTIDILMSLLGPIIDVRLVITPLKIKVHEVIALLLDIKVRLSLCGGCGADTTSTSAITSQIQPCLPNQGVHLFSGTALYQELASALGPPPPGVVPGTSVKAVVLMVDPLTYPDTWSSLQLLMRTSA